MKKHAFTTLLITIFSSILLIPIAIPAQDKDTSEETPATRSLSTVKKFIGSIRYQKNDQAMTYIGVDAMAKYLLGASYAKAKPDELQKFKDLLGEYIRLKAFPLALKYFKDIDLSFDQPVIKGAQSSIKSSLLYAGSERVVFTWVLTEGNGTYLITDFLDGAGTSSMQSSRDKQIQPLFQKKGLAGVNAALQKLVTDLKK